MKPQSTCPETQHLPDLLEGQLPKQQTLDLQEHIETCDACQQTLADLVEGDPSVEKISRHLREPRIPSETALRSAMADMSSPSESETTTGGPSAGSISLDFLDPSNEPGSQGRLAQYEITEVVGRGGMGIVLKGHDTKLGRVVAIKVLAPELASNAGARKRFLREARAAAAVSYDHVVTIYAVDEERLPYLVMEYVDGQSLQQKIDREGHLELKEILRIGRQVAAGLAAAHAQGLIHRDVKPSNILLQNSIERVQITDFGLARAVDDVGITRTGEVAGTPEYMSPEQADGRPVDQRSDLFSLGSVLYAMCAGRSPFRAESTPQVMRRVCEDRPRPIREVNPDVPRWLADLIDKLLQKDPSKRVQTASEVETLLGSYLAHVQDPSGTSLPRPVAPPKWKRRRMWFTVVAAVVVLAAGLGLTEATGVTHLADTVIRIATGEGTLVIEVDDPTVQISLDGEELIITGAGIEELKLRPGEYQFRAAKDGEPLMQELVKITRGHRQLVRVAREPEPSSADAVDSATDYVSVPEGSITRVRRLAGHTSKVTRIIVLRDGRRCLTASHDGTVRLWEIPTSKLLRTFEFCSYWVSPLAIAPDQQVAATEDPKGTILLFNLETGEPLKQLSGHSDAIAHLEFSADGRRLLSRSRDKTVRLWEVDSGKELHRFHVTPWWAKAVAFSPDGGKLLYGDGGFAVLWDMETESEAWRAGNDDVPSHVASIAVSADGRRVATSTFGGPIHLRDAATGTLLGSLVGHPKSSVIAFTPDGRHLVSGDEVDKTLRVWSVETLSETYRIKADRAITCCVAVLPDGRHVISGGGFKHEPPDQWIPEGDYDLHVWRLPESVWPDASATVEKDAFVVLDTHGSEVGKFDTLAEAVVGSSQGDTIEVRGNGPFETDPVQVVHGLTIRAADGFTPVIRGTPDGVPGSGGPLLQALSPLALEGLEFHHDIRTDVENTSDLIGSSAPLCLANCKIVLESTDFRGNAIGASGAILIQNTLLFAPEASAALWSPSPRHSVVENCVQIGFSCACFGAGDDSLQLRGNTIIHPWRPGMAFIFLRIRADDSPAKGTRIVSRNNVFDAGRAAFELSLPREILEPKSAQEKAEPLLPHFLGWNSEHNLYRTGLPLLSIGTQDETFQEAVRVEDCGDLHELCGRPDTGSIWGIIRYQGGDLRARASTQLNELTPNDFRLRPDSAGYRAGPDGKDLGADVDLVGPGEAYERWKQTPEYQEWQKETRKLIQAAQAEPEATDE